MTSHLPTEDLQQKRQSLCVNVNATDAQADVNVHSPSTHRALKLCDM